MTTHPQQPEPHPTDAARRDAPSNLHANHPVATTLPELPDASDGYTHDTRTLLALQALTDTALSHLSLEDLLPELLERVRAVMRVDNVAILLLDESDRVLEVHAARGLEEEAIGHVRIPVGAGFAGRIAAERAPLAIEDLSTYPVSSLFLREKLRSVLGVPLLAGDHVLGVVHIGSATPRQFTAAETTLLEQVAERIARAVERAQLFASIEAARKLAEQRTAFLTTTLEALGDGLVIADADGRLLYSNPAFSALLGAVPGAGADGGANGNNAALTLTSHERLPLLDVRDMSGKPLSLDELTLARALRGETLSGSNALDIQLRRLDGQKAFLSVTGAPVRDEQGAITGVICLYRDITDRLELSEELQTRTRALEEANTQLHTLLQVLPVGVSIVDAAGKPLLVNNAVREVWGQSLPMSESMEQYGDYRAWRADTGERVAPENWGLARALVGGEVSIGSEYDIETFDGQRKTILDSAAPLHDESGTITGAVSVIFDITARRQLERRTRDALEAFITITRTLVEVPESTPAEDARLDASAAASGNDRNTSDRAMSPFRAQNESPLARRLAELTRGILGCSRVGINAVEGEQLLSRPVAVVGLTPEQEPQWWEEQAALPAQTVGEGLLPEDRERLLAGDVLTLDLTRPPYQIPNAYGVTSILVATMRIQNRIVGMLALDFQEPGEQPHVFTPEEIQIAAAIARLGAVVLERDRLLREREAARAEALALAEANRRMDEFLGIAGHELRTPITTIKANLQMAERRTRQVLDANQPSETGARSLSGGMARRPLEQLLHLLERATQSAERQERLVGDLLDISRISAGQLQYRMLPRDLTAVVRETVEEQRLSNPSRQIELEVPEEPVPVTADADRLAQVLTNYLTNALKYSGSNHPVNVTLHRRGKAARVSIRDHGPGLSAARQRHLFERFHRVPGVEVVSGSGVGLGLGLYISKTIVEQHGGRVGVESAPGQGSTFWFSLPLAESGDRVLPPSLSRK